MRKGHYVLDGVVMAVHTVAAYLAETTSVAHAAGRLARGTKAVQDAAGAGQSPESPHCHCKYHHGCLHEARHVHPGEKLQHRCRLLSLQALT